MPIRRGEIYLVALPNRAKARPAIILTEDWLSQYALDVSVVPVTSVARANFPTRVELQAGEGGLLTRSWAKCDQVTTVPKSLLASTPFGRLGGARMQAIAAAVRLALGL
jgi:mRNA-degrading endonuclease toxin of MazEF toxin-antitoxin module